MCLALVTLNVLQTGVSLSQTMALFSLKYCLCFQVMETERMIYLVTEYASGGEIFGKGLYPEMQTLAVVVLFSLYTIDFMPGIKNNNNFKGVNLCDLFCVLG